MAKIPFYSIKSLIGGSGGGGGTTTEVKVDGVTVEKLTGSKLQANAIIPVTDLPTTDIKAKSIYQKQDGDFIKNYIYVDNKWQSVSIIDLTAQQYDSLTNEQKTDGTLYIVSDDSNPNITCAASDVIIDDGFNWSSYSLPDMAKNDNDYNVNVYSYEDIYQ